MLFLTTMCRVIVQQLSSAVVSILFPPLWSTYCCSRQLENWGAVWQWWRRS